MGEFTESKEEEVKQAEEEGHPCGEGEHNDCMEGGRRGLGREGGHKGRGRGRPKGKI